MSQQTKLEIRVFGFQRENICGRPHVLWTVEVINPRGQVLWSREISQGYDDLSKKFYGICRAADKAYRLKSYLGYHSLNQEKFAIIDGELMEKKMVPVFALAA